MVLKSTTNQPSGDDTSLGPQGRTPVEVEKRVAIHTDRDIVVARQQGRTLAATLGFSSTDLTLIATTISELARNILRYAQHGEMELQLSRELGKEGIVVIARDDGPGIVDIDRALESGYSTSGNLGLGLPGVRRLMDEFEITSARGQGTVVVTKKWRQ